MAQVSVVGPDSGEPIQLGPTRKRILADGSTAMSRYATEPASDFA